LALYFVFVNPETWDVIKNDRLSKGFSSSNPTITEYPGVSVHVRDYNGEDFDSVCILYTKTDNVIAPFCAFIDKINAEKHYENMSKKVTEDAGHIFMKKVSVVCSDVTKNKE